MSAQATETGSGKTVELHVRRQERAGAPEKWEVFHIRYRPNLNIIACLMDLQLNPTTVTGEKTTAPAWEAACLEEVCGSCTMVINGTPRQACTTLVDRLEQPIRIQAMTKFPIVRDLIVDRSRMFD